ncbi:MAG: Fic family protein [Erysipelotrichaceae bacterium]|nr:Fic family protein [Erysipelotrichaceae bacterium]
MRKYDYSFLKGSTLSEMLRLAQIIADLKTRSEVRMQQYGEVYARFQKKAIIDSVRCSNAIEGIVTTQQRLQDIVAGHQPVSHDEMEIAGYRDALRLIFEKTSSLNLNEDLIRGFHRLIEQQSDPDQAGMYKENDNFIMEYDADGNRRVRFTPVKASEVEKNMEQLLLAFYDARQDEEIPDILLIPCFVVDFLCIHPFKDGNGRVSRLLNVLLLLTGGYDIVRFISLEKQIDEFRQNYYDALAASSAGWHEGVNDYTPFILFSMQILYRCYRQMDESFFEFTIRKEKKSERVTKLLMNSIVPLSKKDIMERLPDISETTVEKQVAKLLKEEMIEKSGSFRDARYRRKV